MVSFLGRQPQLAALVFALRDGAVHAAQPDGLSAQAVDLGYELLIDQSGQHGRDHFQRIEVGDAQPLGEARGNIQPGQPVRDGVAAAVDDHDRKLSLLKCNEVFQGGIMLAERAAADFYDYDFRS